MKIIFQKKKDRNIIRIIRDDESDTWTKTSNVGVLHDLCHYAIEKQLDYRQSFYGLINQGFNIPDFEKPREQRPAALIPANLPLEAIQTEYIVNLFQTGIIDRSIHSDYLRILRETLEPKEIEFPKGLNETTALQIQEYLDQLIAAWNDLPLEESMVLELWN